MMTMEMVRCVWQLVYVIVTSVAAAEAGVGQVMILEDEPLSTSLAGKPMISGKLHYTFFLFETWKPSTMPRP